MKNEKLFDAVSGIEEDFIVIILLFKCLHV